MKNSGHVIPRCGLVHSSRSTDCLESRGVEPLEHLEQRIHGVHESRGSLGTAGGAKCGSSHVALPRRILIHLSSYITINFFLSPSLPILIHHSIFIHHVSQERYILPPIIPSPGRMGYTSTTKLLN